MPSTPPRGDDQDQVPDQIVVDTQGQPLENQSSRIPEPSQTPRQTPQVYIAGTIPSRLTLERSPSLPRNFSPSEFACRQTHQKMMMKPKQWHLRKQELNNYCHQVIEAEAGSTLLPAATTSL
jgi:hypothetical protein